MIGLYDQPILVADPGMHTAIPRRIGVDRIGQWAVTGSDDKTVRVWSVPDGALVRTIRLPAGLGQVGMVYAVAITPDGTLIAAGGFTGPIGAPKAISFFDRATGALLRRIAELPQVPNDLAFSTEGDRLAVGLG
jgi:WD40 repeat protein